MKRRYVISIDPSGNYIEGKGTTGLAVYDRKLDSICWVGYVRAETYESQVAYWKGVIRTIDLLIHRYPKSVLSVEDYLLYSNTARSQINSTFETPQLIGVIKYTYDNRPIYIRPASKVKRRWTDEILIKKGYLKYNRRIGYHIVNEEGETIQVIIHCRDAIRHAIHCGKFEMNEN